MNWTGGARSRASKASSGIAHKQKQFFAKVRAKMTSEAYQGSSSSPTVNPDEDDQETNDSLPRPSILKKSRKNRTPEFDIVVGKENPDQEDEEDVIDAPLRKKPKISEDQQYGADDSTLTGARRHAGKKQDRIKARLALLSEEDWLCTTVAVPLAPRSKKEQKRFESPHPLPTPARPFKHPETATSIGRPSAYLARPNAHASPTLFRASQPITEDASEYRHHPDTGVNIFKPLSQNGYVKIGKGGLPGTAADPTSQDSFLLDLDDEDEDDYPLNRLLL